MCKTIFESSPPTAADAVAAALAEGIDPADIGEAISLAANQLVLRDAGRPERWASPGKPPGSVHGDSIGVHASDAVNAWRNMARVVNPRNAAACLILAGYEVARDRQARAAEFLKWAPRPLAEFLEAVKPTDPKGCWPRPNPRSGRTSRRSPPRWCTATARSATTPRRCSR